MLGFTSQPIELPDRWRKRALRLSILVLTLLAGSVLPAATANAASTPSTPGNVTAIATSTTTIHVTWSGVSGAKSYVVSNGSISSPDLTSTNYDWSGLAPGTYMCFTVTAKNSLGQSPWSPYACATTPLNTPGPVTAVPTSAFNIHVSWGGVTGATSYVVSNGSASSPDLGTTSYDWYGLTPGTYMCFTIAAKNSLTQSPWSSYACTTTPSTPWCPSSDPTHPTCDSTGAFQESCDVSTPCTTPVNDYKSLPPDPQDGTGNGPDDIESAELVDVNGGFKVLGWSHASDFLWHYLNNAGTDLSFDSTDAYHEGAGFAAAVNATVKQWIQTVNVAGDTFDSGYLDFPAVGVSTSTWQNEDWQNAVGHGFYRVVGTRHGDGSWSIQLQLTSYYQFRAGGDFSKWGGIIDIKGADVRHLVKIGWAQNFREVGNGTLRFDAAGNPA